MIVGIWGFAEVEILILDFRDMIENVVNITKTRPTIYLEKVLT
jgi:hypothetical protein